MGKAISVPTLFVNNIPFKIASNTASVKLGKGTKTVRTASLGGGAVQIIVTENAEDKFGEIKISLFVDSESIAIAKSWADQIGTLFVALIQPGDIPLTMGNATLTNDPEWSLTADGVAECIFQGDPIS